MTTAAEILEAVRQRYGRSGVVIAEVPDATGYAARRRLDAVAIGCWPSRGLFYHGIEIKVSRGDLTRELRNPEKAEAVGAYCDAFWIACPKDMADPDELPPSWGLYEYHGGSVRPKKKAHEKTAAPCDRSWVAALIRAVVEQQSDEKILNAVRDKAYGAGWDACKVSYEEENAQLHAREDELLGQLRQYQIIMRGYRAGQASPRQLGHIMKCFDSLQGHYGALNSLRVSAKQIIMEADAIEAVARELFPELEES